MPIPEFDAIKAPALQFFHADGEAHKMAEVFKTLAVHFQLSEAEQEELLPSGGQRRWHNRANWACYDLYRAGLIERIKKGVYKITVAGQQVAEQKPLLINRDFLMQFPSFAQWMQATNTKEPSKGGEKDIAVLQQTPIEIIAAAHQVLNASVKKELLELVAKMDPYRFEQLVLDLLVAMGYGGSREEAAQVTKASNDEGIDGIINEDRLGLDVIYLQAKRWQKPVGRPELQSFVGALAGKQAHKGVFLTTSVFTDNAISFAKMVPQKIVLISGERLADLMVQHNIGTSRSHYFEIKQVDSDYFEAE